MTELGMTYVNFASCELVGDWEMISEGLHEDIDVYESREENAAVNVRILTENKTSYYMRKGARIYIRGNILRFNKEDFSK